MVSGHYQMTHNDARDFGALQLQIMFGDHDPNKHKKGFITLDAFVSPTYRKDKKIEAEIYLEHKKLIGAHPRSLFLPLLFLLS